MPFLAFDPEIRRVICSTNAIESVNARIRRAVKARGHFPNYLAVMGLNPTGIGRKRWTMRWNPHSTHSGSPSTVASPPNASSLTSVTPLL